MKYFNATEAARRAGYKGNENTVASIGSQNFRKVKIREKIDDYMEEKAMNGLEVIYRLSKQARGGFYPRIRMGSCG